MQIRVARRLWWAVTAATVIGVALIPGSAQAAAGQVAWGTTISAPAGTLAQLFGVAAVPGQAWAVGGYNPGVSPTAVLTSPYAEHWDGTAWTATAVPLGQVYPSGSQGAQLLGAAAVTASDVWAVGDVDNLSSLASQTLAFHWNGATWSRAATPNPGGTSLGNHLKAVAARASTAVFAVGDSGGYPAKSLVLRFNGSAWSTLTVPDVGALTAVAVDAATVWVAGGNKVQRFNGTTWTRLPALPPGSGTVQLAGLAKATTGLWAVGTDLIPYFEGYIYAPYAAVWNGSTWTRVSAAASAGFSAVTAAGSTVWATSATTVTRLTPTGSTPEVTPALAGQLSAVTADSTGKPWAVGVTGRGPAIINAPGINQGGISVTTGASGATVTWIGPVTGSGSTTTSGSFAVGGLPVGAYTVVAALGGCTPGVATAVVTAGVVTPVSATIHC